MGLKRDFLIHRRKTVESFRFVKADISSANANIEQIKNMPTPLEFKIGNLEKSMDRTIEEVKSIKDKSDNLASKNSQIAKTVSSSKISIKKIKNFMNRKLRAMSRINLELNAKLKNQRKRMTELNRKIESKKVLRIKSIKRKPLPKKITKKTVTPTKTTITEVVNK